MDPQQQTSNQAQPQAQDTNGAPQFDPNFVAQLSNPDAMAGILPGQGLVTDPNIASLSMGDPSMMLPMMFANGQVPAPMQATKSISAGKASLFCIAHAFCPPELTQVD